MSVSNAFVLCALKINLLYHMNEYVIYISIQFNALVRGYMRIRTNITNLTLIDVGTR